MATQSKLSFNQHLYKQRLMKRAVEVQTERLIAYAKVELERMVATKELRDDTKNLKDSIVWAVYYNGKRVPNGFGFYGNKEATENSYLHEYSSNPQPVNGRALARQFVQEYSPTTIKGWEIVWAVCAPYAAYWEGGHVNPPKSGRMRYAKVILQRYDHIRNALTSKTHTTFAIHRPTS